MSEGFFDFLFYGLDEQAYPHQPPTVPLGSSTPLPFLCGLPAWLGMESTNVLKPLDQHQHQPPVPTQPPHPHHPSLSSMPHSSSSKGELGIILSNPKISGSGLAQSVPKLSPSFSSESSLYYRKSAKNLRI